MRVPRIAGSPPSAFASEALPVGRLCERAAAACRRRSSANFAADARSGQVLDPARPSWRFRSRGSRAPAGRAQDGADGVLTSCEMARARSAMACFFSASRSALHQTGPRPPLWMTDARCRTTRSTPAASGAAGPPAAGRDIQKPEKLAVVAAGGPRGSSLPPAPPPPAEAQQTRQRLVIARNRRRVPPPQASCAPPFLGRAKDTQRDRRRTLQRGASSCGT